MTKDEKVTWIIGRFNATIPDVNLFLPSDVQHLFNGFAQDYICHRNKIGGGKAMRQARKRLRKRAAAYRQTITN